MKTNPYTWLGLPNLRTSYEVADGKVRKSTFLGQSETSILDSTVITESDFLFGDVRIQTKAGSIVFKKLYFPRLFENAIKKEIDKFHKEARLEDFLVLFPTLPDVIEPSLQQIKLMGDTYYRWIARPGDFVGEGEEIGPLMVAPFDAKVFDTYLHINPFPEQTIVHYNLALQPLKGALLNYAMQKMYAPMFEYFNSKRAVLARKGYRFPDEEFEWMKRVQPVKVPVDTEEEILRKHVSVSQRGG